MEKFTQIFNQYASSELLILVPVLFIIGKLLIMSKIPKHKIPIIVTVLSIVLCTAHTFSTVPILNVSCILLALFTSVTQGILFAGASILGKVLYECKCSYKKPVQSEENE